MLKILLLEAKLEKDMTIPTIDALVVLLTQVVEFYSSREDPIHIYFLEKIRNTLSKSKAIKMYFREDIGGEGGESEDEAATYSNISADENNHRLELTSSISTSFDAEKLKRKVAKAKKKKGKGKKEAHRDKREANDLDENDSLDDIADTKYTRRNSKCLDLYQSLRNSIDQVNNMIQAHSLILYVYLPDPPSL